MGGGAGLRCPTDPGSFAWVVFGGGGVLASASTKGSRGWFGGPKGCKRGLEGGGATEEISALNRNYLQNYLVVQHHTHTVTTTSDLAPPAGGHQYTRTVVKPPGSVCPAGLCQTTRCQLDRFSPVALRQSGGAESPFTRGRSLSATWHFKKLSCTKCSVRNYDC